MSELTIVTGASSNHFRCLTNLLYSISVFEPGTRTIIYDLGLNEHERAQLIDENRELRRFRFEDYPSHLDIRVHCGQYAWKPVIVADTLAETGGDLLWLDAGDLVLAPLEKIRTALLEHGLYSPRSGRTIGGWTHRRTIKYMGVPKRLLGKRNCHGAIVGVSPHYPGVGELVQEWKRCALDRRCIAPYGSSRFNHRQDQAVLSVLVAQYQEKYGWVLIDEKLDVSTHNDHRSRDEVIARLNLASQPAP